MALMKLYNFFGKKRSWATGEGGTRRKQYGSYDEYIAHQRAKLDTIKNLDKKWARLKAGLAERLGNVPQVKRGANALCLGARLGAEVEALIDFGVFAIGIDLNPGSDNRFVVNGDFHHIQYADASVDIVYTNSLDHVFELDKVMAEVLRVLKPDGVFIADIESGDKDPGYFASTRWDSTDEMIDTIAKGRFKITSRDDFTIPSAGTQVLFAPSRQ